MHAKRDMHAVHIIIPNEAHLYRRKNLLVAWISFIISKQIKIVTLYVSNLVTGKLKRTISLNLNKKIREKLGLKHSQLLSKS